MKRQKTIFVVLLSAALIGLQSCDDKLNKSTNTEELVESEKEVAIEIKAKNKITTRDCKNLKLLGEEIPLRRKIIVCNEPISYKFDDGIEVMTIIDFLKMLWEKGV